MEMADSSSWLMQKGVKYFSCVNKNNLVEIILKTRRKISTTHMAKYLYKVNLDIYVNHIIYIYVHYQAHIIVQFSEVELDTPVLF